MRVLRFLVKPRACRKMRKFGMLIGLVLLGFALVFFDWNYNTWLLFWNSYFEPYNQYPMPSLKDTFYADCTASASVKDFARKKLDESRDPWGSSASKHHDDAASCASLRDSEFRQVDTQVPDLYVYAAYLDRRQADWPPLVRVMAHKLPTKMHHITCHFFDKQTGQLLHSHQSTKLNGRGSGMHRLAEYSTPSWVSYILTCPLPDDATVLDKICSVVLSLSQADEQIRHKSQLRITEGRAIELPLRDTKARANERVACIRNLHKADRIPLNFLSEFLELTRRLGVRETVMYVSERLPLALQALLATFEEEQGMRIRLVPWFLPEPDQVYSFSQPLLTNDCLLRVNSVAEFVQFQDIDELMVPAMSRSSLDDAIEAYFRDYPKRQAMCLHNMYYPYQQMPNGTAYRFASVSKTCQYRDRTQSKCVVKARQILEMSVHRPWLDIDNHWIWQSMAGLEEYAQMLHVRGAYWKFCANHHPERDLVEAPVHLRFVGDKDEWTGRMDERLARVRKLCGLA